MTAYAWKIKIFCVVAVMLSLPVCRAEELKTIGIQYFGAVKAPLKNLQSRGLRETGLEPVYPADVGCFQANSFFGDTRRGDGSTRNPRFYFGYHTGLDIPAPEGTPIVAIADGTVISKSMGRDDGIGGIELVIQHSPSDTGLPVWVYSQYKHLRDLPVWDIGRKVKMGEQIAVCGSTGTAGKHYGKDGLAHLHLSVYMSPDDQYAAKVFFFPPQGQWIDPLAVYRSGGRLDTDFLRALSKTEKKVSVSCLTDKGRRILFGNGRFIWPFIGKEI